MVKVKIDIAYVIKQWLLKNGFIYNISTGKQYRYISNGRRVTVYFDIFHRNVYIFDRKCCRHGPIKCADPNLFKMIKGVCDD